MFVKDTAMLDFAMCMADVSGAKMDGMVNHVFIHARKTVFLVFVTEKQGTVYHVNQDGKA